MRRIAFSLLAIAALTAATLAQAPPAKPATPVAAPAPAAPVPPGAAPVATSDYYPLKVGNQWTYRIDEQRTLTMRVDKFENGEATINTVAGNRTVATDTIKVKPDGIYRIKINNLAITPEIKILALPVKKDTTWDVNSSVQEKKIVGKLTIKEEKVKIKLKDGKEYECVEVDGPDFKVDAATIKIKQWFCPGKGIVKLSYETGPQEAVLELSEFTEGK